jgi:iron(III) transport system permease protein
VNSIKFSLQAAIMVVVIVLIGTYLRKHKKNIATGFIEYSFLIPWMLPGTLIAIGLITSFSTPSVFIFGQILIGTSLLLVLGYIIIRMPFTSRLLRAAFQALDDDYIKAAKSLGSGPFYAFRRITIPLIFPTIIALVALGFNDLLRDYNMAAFLAHPLDQTLGMLIYSYTLTESTGDSRAFIFVFSTILMIISGITIYIVYGIILNDQKPQFIQSIQKRLLVISGKVKDRFLNSKV